MFKSPLFQPGEPVREPKVFICYRHLDSKAHVGRLRDRLHTTLGPDAAFLDKDDLPPGGEFPEEIAETIKNCDALLVVIGPNWLDEDNRRRLHEPGDFVRQEVAVEFQNLLSQWRTGPLEAHKRPRPRVLSRPAVTSVRPWTEQETERPSAAISYAPPSGQK